MLSFGQFLIRADDMQTQNITLITDSIFDIPDDLLRQYEIGRVPANVIWGNEILRAPELSHPIWLSWRADE